MGHWSGTVLATIGAVAAIAAIAGILGTAFRSSARTTALNNYREVAESQKMRIDEQSAQILELQADAAEKDKKIAALTAKIETLTDLLTNRVALQDLATSVTHINQVVGEMIQGLARIEATLAEGAKP